MNPQQLEEIKELIGAKIREEVSISIDKKLKPIWSKLNSIQGVVDLIQDTQSSDIKAQGDVATSMSKVEQGHKEIRTAISNQTKVIGDRVRQGVEEAIDTAVEKVEESVEPAIAKVANKMQKGIQLNQPKWWEIWKRIKYELK